MAIVKRTQKQRKWFDVYAKADEAHSMLVGYRKIYPASTQDESVQARNAWNQRKRHPMAVWTEV